MKALVTGGDGFVGEHLIAELLEAGDRVTASCLSLPPHRSTLSPEQASGVEWKVADVLDPGALYRVVAAVRPDCIYHLAGVASGRSARARPEEALRVNAGGTVNLMEATIRTRSDFPGLDPLVLVMGSGHAYGTSARGRDRVAEAEPLHPEGPYGLSKACQELAADAYRRGRGVRAVTVRPFNLIGPGQKPGFVVPDLCTQAAAIVAGKAEPVLDVGNLDAERDFTDVRDAAEALRRVAALEDSGPAYNVCSGVGTTIRAILAWILDEAEIDPEVRVASDRVREGEIARLVGDPDRLKRATGWSAGRPAEATVRETYRWVAGPGERASSSSAARRASDG